MHAGYQRIVAEAVAESLKGSSLTLPRGHLDTVLHAAGKTQADLQDDVDAGYERAIAGDETGDDVTGDDSPEHLYAMLVKAAFQAEWYGESPAYSQETFERVLADAGKSCDDFEGDLNAMLAREHRLKELNDQRDSMFAEWLEQAAENDRPPYQPVGY